LSVLLVFVYYNELQVYKRVIQIVAYQLKQRAITIDGDVCDCDGTMQGGTRRNVGRLVDVCQSLRKANSEKKRLTQLVEELRKKIHHYNKYEIFMSNPVKISRLPSQALAKGSQIYFLFQEY